MEENDNQFPAEEPLDLEEIEGSGAGAIDIPENETKTSVAPNLEEVESNSVGMMGFAATIDEPQSMCPNVCTCSSEGEGDTYSLIVDCSDKELTEMPEYIDVTATTLNLHNNKLKIIPKSIAELKKLKKLIASNNSITDLENGVSNVYFPVFILNLYYSKDSKYFYFLVW